MDSSSVPKDSPTDLVALKRKSVRGGLITLASQVVIVAIHLTSTVVLARLLLPSDYGTIAMVTAITAFAALFRDLGLSAAAVQKGSLTQAEMSNLFWLNVGLGAALTALLAAASPLVAWFYSKPELLPLTLFMSLSFVITSLGTQHGALMHRNLQFGRKSAITIAGAGTSLAVSVAFALHDYSYWALAIGNIAGAVLTTALLIITSPFHPGRWSKTTKLMEMAKFGANVTGFDFLNYFYRNLDNVLIGRFSGADALGLYSRAYHLMMFPITNLRGPILSVAFPALSRLQNEPDNYRQFYRKIALLLAFLSMPLICYFAFVAERLIEFVLGSQWDGVVPFFSVLAIAAFIQPVASLRGVVMLSLGLGRRYLGWGIMNTSTAAIAFIAGIQWGPMGIAVAYSVHTYALLIPSLFYVFRSTPLNPKDFFTSIIRPATASIATFALLFTVSRSTAEINSPVLHLIASGGAFAAVFLAVYVFMPGGAKELRQMKSLFFEMIKRKKVKK